MQRRYKGNSSFPPPPFFHLPDSSPIHTTDDHQPISDPDPFLLSSHPHIDPNHLVSSIRNTNQDQPNDEVILYLNTNDPPVSYTEPPPPSCLLQDDVNIETPNPDINKEKLKSLTNQWSYSPLNSLGMIFVKNVQPLPMMLDSLQLI